jgi:putative DNA primase/helicase
MKVADALALLDRAHPCGGGYVARCPSHEDSRPSLSIREGDNGHALMKCFRGCPYEAIVEALDSRQWRHIPGLLLSNPLALDDAKRTEIARRIWREAKPATGTLVETYLRSRGITMRVPPTLRFYSALRHPSGTFLLPTMVAVVSDLNRNVVAVHRTYLDDQGNKTNLEPPKAALGPIARRAVHLAPAGEMLALAEGIETALSVGQATGIPTWAALGTANLTRVELPAVVREVIICADNDPSCAGEKAALAAAERFKCEGRRVSIARPHVGKDFNDMRL